MPNQEQEKRYNDTQEFLENQLQDTNKIIDLINSIKYPEKRYTYQEVLDIEENIKILTNRGSAQSKETLTLMLKAKSERRKEKNRDYAPLIIDTSPKYDKKNNVDFFTEYIKGLRYEQ